MGSRNNLIMLLSLVMQILIPCVSPRPTLTAEEPCASLANLAKKVEDLAQREKKLQELEWNDLGIAMDKQGKLYCQIGKGDLTAVHHELTMARCDLAEERVRLARSGRNGPSLVNELRKLVDELRKLVMCEEGARRVRQTGIIICWPDERVTDLRRHLREIRIELAFAEDKPAAAARELQAAVDEHQGIVQAARLLAGRKFISPEELKEREWDHDVLSGRLEAARERARAKSDSHLIITLGDSITRGVRSGVKAEETFAARVQHALHKQNINVQVINVGIGGERTDQALQRLSKAVIALKPQVVTIMYGTNDSYVDKDKTEPRLTVAQYEANLKSLIAKLREAEITPILMTPPAWGKAAKNGAGNDPNILLEKYVDACRKVARETKTPLVDHFAIWSNKAADDFDIGKEWTTDQCHPNPRGHQVIADSMLPVILETLRTKRRD